MLVPSSVNSSFFVCFFFNDTATTEIYTLSLHDALLISLCAQLHLLADSRSDRPAARPAEHLVRRFRRHRHPPADHAVSARAGRTHFLRFRRRRFHIFSRPIRRAGAFVAEFGRLEIPPAISALRRPADPGNLRAIALDETSRRNRWLVTRRRRSNLLAQRGNRIRRAVSWWRKRVIFDAKPPDVV